MNYLICGATSFIAKALIESLSTNKKNQIYITVRNKDQISLSQTNIHILEWSSIHSSLTIPIQKIDVVINCIGANIAQKRWNNERKKELYNSRIDSTKRIAEELKRQKVEVSSYIGLSGVGIYPISKTSIHGEKASLGDGFLSQLCQDWESEAIRSFDFANRLTIFRLGLVLGKSGGAVSRMLPAFKLGLGGKLGDGRQLISWVHMTDLVRMIEMAGSSNEYDGIINAVSPFSVTNNEFTQVLGKSLRKKTPVPVPKRALKLVLGEMSSLLLDSVNVKPERLTKNKFHYYFPTIELALKDVVSKV